MVRAGWRWAARVTHAVGCDDCALIYDQHYDPDLYDAAHAMCGTFPTSTMCGASHPGAVVPRRSPAAPHFGGASCWPLAIGHWPPAPPPGFMVRAGWRWAARVTHAVPMLWVAMTRSDLRPAPRTGPLRRRTCNVWDLPCINNVWNLPSWCRFYDGSPLLLTFLASTEGSLPRALLCC